MTPTPAPPYVGPVVCAPTIERLDAMQLAEYSGPHRDNASFSVLRDGPWALVSFEIGDEGGHAMMRHDGVRWCRVSNGGGGIDESILVKVAGPVHGHRLWSMWQGK